MGVLLNSVVMYECHRVELSGGSERLRQSNELVLMVALLADRQPIEKPGSRRSRGIQNNCCCFNCR